MQHTVRTRDGGTRTFGYYTRQGAISLFCSECLGWGDDPEICTSKLCPLYPFRRRTTKALRSDGRGRVG